MLSLRYVNYYCQLNKNRGRKKMKRPMLYSGKLRKANH